MRRRLFFSLEDVQGLEEVVEVPDEIVEVGNLDINPDDILKEQLEINVIQEIVDDADSYYDEFVNYKNILEENKEIDEDSAYILANRVESVKEKLNISVESIVEPHHFSNKFTKEAANTFAMESVVSIIKRIWKAIKDSFKYMWDSIKNFYRKMFGPGERFKEKINRIKKELDDNEYKIPNVKTINDNNLFKMFAIKEEITFSGAKEIINNHITFITSIEKNMNALVNIVDNFKKHVDVKISMYKKQFNKLKDDSKKNLVNFNAIIEESNKDNPDIEEIAKHLAQEDESETISDLFKDMFGDHRTNQTEEEDLADDNISAIFTKIVETLQENKDNVNDDIISKINEKRGTDITNKEIYRSSRLIENKSVYVYYREAGLNTLKSKIDYSRLAGDIFIDKYDHTEKNIEDIDDEEVDVLTQSQMKELLQVVEKLHNLLEKVDYEKALNKIETNINYILNKYEELNILLIDREKGLPSIFKTYLDTLNGVYEFISKDNNDYNDTIKNFSSFLKGLIDSAETKIKEKQETSNALNNQVKKNIMTMQRTMRTIFADTVSDSGRAVAYGMNWIKLSQNCYQLD